MLTMTTTIVSTLVKHKHIIMLTIAAAALAAYVLPFDNIMGVADAAYKTPKKSSFKKDSKDSFSIKIGAAQSAVLNSGILGGGGGGGYTGEQAFNTAFNFLQ